MNISAKCWNSMNLPPEERISKKAFKSNSTACVAWEINLDNSKKGRDIFTYTNTKSTLHPSIHTHTLYAFYCIVLYVMFNWRAALCFPKCAVAGVNVGLPHSATENLSNLQIWQTRDMISKWPGQQQQQQRSVRVRGACNQKMSFCWHFLSNRHIQHYTGPSKRLLDGADSEGTGTDPLNPWPLHRVLPC